MNKLLQSMLLQSMLLQSMLLQPIYPVYVSIINFNEVPYMVSQIPRAIYFKQIFLGAHLFNT
ncbi:hypothetical protein EO94_18305 [Methanosarcina sp. 2.H.T.1A.3]|nr:hypothetical protein EO94_18305 [Methanosarcina sp. 2.H.T.1A.3]KKG23400.1 hypothetical protein EO96_17270 [Methanosarcina sp. 2.H.T.1A.8]KKG27692.1 hypothetical protein EO97_19985 [Methanosarcina sp. 2.H.T.1A.15]